MIAQLDADYLRARPMAALPRLISYLLYEGRPITTRGRWINPLVLRLLDAQKHLPELRPVRRPVFIVGTGRSGTTIAGKLLSMHREVAFLNEPKALWHALHPNEDVIGNYSLGPASYRIPATDATPPRVSHAHRILGAYLALTRRSRVVDKYPELVFRMDFVRRIFPDAIFVAVVRDGWATIRSVERWTREHAVREGDRRADWWGVEDRKWKLLVRDIATGDPDLRSHVDTLEVMRSHVDRAAVEWLLTMRELLRHHESDSGPRLLRYEDLTSVPGAGARQLLRSTGLQHDEAVLRYASRTLRPAHAGAPIVLHPLVEGAFGETCERMAAALAP